MERPFERVYTVLDFWDGPRSGFADFDGAPHAYRSIWRDDLGDWDPGRRFELSPISAEVLALALEDWAIWRRWEEAFYAGDTTTETHPALPVDQPRHSELAPLIDLALQIDPAQRRVAVGEFLAREGHWRPPGSPTSHITLEVRWTPVE
jgi:hypothetical protein